MKNQPSTDSIFAAAREKVSQFVFDERVARVFDDMIDRSVPGYRDIVAFSALLAEIYAKDDSICYDLGCSLGAVTLAMRERIQGRDCRIIAVDNAEAMIERCRENIAAQASSVPVDARCADLCDIPIENASVVVLNFTLQFVEPGRRETLLKKIYAGMLPGAALILSEKIAFSDPQAQAHMSKLHHYFKKTNGYSDLEISQKRSALENVLIPDSLARHLKRLQKVGFQRSDVWFQCFNFASLLAVK